MRKLFIKVKISIISFLIIVTSCAKENENQDLLYSKFENEILKNIIELNAKKFEYKYDGLTPQNTYFIGCNLSLLTLKSSGEYTDTQNLIIFKNDSITKIITRETTYEGYENQAGRNWNKIESDMIYVKDFKNNTMEIYSDNRLRKTKQNYKEDLKYFYKVKEQTEMEYNCH